jgi:transposase
MYALTAAMMRAQRMYQSLHGLPRVNDRRVLNGIFWVQRSVSPWRDLPENFGPYINFYNRFVWWHAARQRCKKAAPG